MLKFYELKIGNNLNRLFGQWTIELLRQIISLEIKKSSSSKSAVKFISEFRLTGSIIMCPSGNFFSFTLAFKLLETKFYF